MFYIFLALALLAALLLIGVVLIQKSKGGGLSSTFAGSNQIMGVRRTNNFIEKVTWTLAGSILVLSIACAYTIPSHNTTQDIKTKAPASTITTGANYDTPVAATEEAAEVTPVEVEAPAENAAE
ncbi:MAG: preprotein translocase subunit SecG [Paramuribaculum sp.]|nr:preprotein translocase subunit SecG [Paramuribaculum sp.]